MPSIKLCVTVSAHLKAKYTAAAQARIDAALGKWIKADDARGIKTNCVALDDAAAMKRLGATAVRGRVTAVRAKRALDALCRALTPEYVVILGGDEIVPYFRVPNPSLNRRDGDDDNDVLTDNPYACSAAYRVSDRATYLVPDRVVGRITDLDGDADPRWLIDQLARATAHASKPASFYAKAYAVCCSAWGPAGRDCMAHVGLPEDDLMISPPTVDATPTMRKRLARTLHMIKCHGGNLEAAYAGQRGGAYPDVLTSATLAGRMSADTLVAAMCCYGAQIYSPDDPAAKPAGAKALPMAAAYLREGALAMMGATKIAWVGTHSMQCADWIVSGYLKSLLAGASVGRALQEAKQEYVRWLATQGQAPDRADEKTLIEFVLLADPSVHPVMAAAAPARAVAAGARAVASRAVTSWAGTAARAADAAGERAQRRAVRAQIGGQMRRNLPDRRDVAQPNAQVAKRLLGMAVAHMLAAGEVIPDLQPAAVQACALSTGTAPPAQRAIASVARAVAAARPQRRESVEYYWSTRRNVQGRPQIQLLKVEADRDGNFLRSRLLHSA